MGVVKLLKGVIMAGGEGTRLRPLTSNRPKPMVPLCNRPIMEYGLKLLRMHGVKEVGVTLHYLPHVIMEHFRDGSSLGLRLRYSIESSPLGTAGGIKRLEDFLDETFVVISGDVFTDIDLGEMLRFHKSRGALMTIALTRVQNPTEFGIALIDDDGRLVRYLEKPSWGEVFSDLINMGIYVLEPEVLDYIPKDKVYDFSRDLIPTLLKSGEPIYGWVVDKAYWSDIGNHEQYLTTHFDLLVGKVRTDLPGYQINRGIWIGEGSEIEEEALITPPVLIGKNVRIKRGARVGPYAVLGDGVIVDSGASIVRSIVWEYTYLGQNVNLRGAIVAARCCVSRGVLVMEGAVVGDECRIGRHAVIKPGVKIWPSKIIDPYTVVSLNLKWGIRWPRNIFGPWGIEGLANIEVTPELAIRIGLAIGSWLGSSAKVVVARDPYKSSRMIKRALVAGLLATGVRVYNLKVAPTPVLRHFVKYNKMDAGVMIETPLINPNAIRIKVFNNEGMEIGPLDERKIEGLLNKEEFRRTLSDEMGELVYPTEVFGDYLRTLLSHVRTSLIRRTELKVVVDCGNSAASLIIPTLLEELGVKAVLLNSRAGDNLAPRGIYEVTRMIEVVSNVVRALDADIGIIFDEDADRLLIVDDEGKPISGDLALALFADMELSRSGGGCVVVPNTASRIIEEVAKNNDGRVVRSKVGAKYVLHKMKEVGAIFGGEERGAYAFPEFQVGFDGIMAMCRILEELAYEGVPLSSLISKLPPTFMLKRSVKVPFELRGRILRRALEELKEHEIDTIDGIKVLEAGGWVLIHPRPHEPFFDLYVEASNHEAAKIMLRRYLTFLENLVAGV